jgi:hypothetical protein
MAFASYRGYVGTLGSSAGPLGSFCLTGGPAKSAKSEEAGAETQLETEAGGGGREGGLLDGLLRLRPSSGAFVGDAGIRGWSLQ